MSKLSGDRHKILIANEQTRSLSQWLNAISAAMIGAGVISVSVGYILFLNQQSFLKFGMDPDGSGLKSRNEDAMYTIIIVVIAWGVLGLLFRLASNVVLRRLKEEV